MGEMADPLTNSPLSSFPFFLPDRIPFCLGGSSVPSYEHSPALAANGGDVTEGVRASEV